MEMDRQTKQDLISQMHVFEWRWTDTRNQIKPNETELDFTGRMHVHEAKSNKNGRTNTCLNRNRDRSDPIESTNKTKEDKPGRVKACFVWERTAVIYYPLDSIQVVSFRFWNEVVSKWAIDRILFQVWKSKFKIKPNRSIKWVKSCPTIIELEQDEIFSIISELVSSKVSHIDLTNWLIELVKIKSNKIFW